MRNLIRYNPKLAASCERISNCSLFEIESQDAPRFSEVARKQTASLRMMTRLTIQWTRGETACLIKTSSVKLGVARSGFARVISAVRWLSIVLKLDQMFGTYCQF